MDDQNNDHRKAEYNGQKVWINPLVDVFHDSWFTFRNELDNVEKVWNDAASESFRHEVTDYSKKVSLEYLQGVIKIFQGYKIIVEESQKLTNWNAGMHGWMSLFDVGMLAERGLSRLLFKRDDYRF